jgi:Na+/melibiose symporter-like transporter
MRPAALAAYGALGLPLAMVALPVYMQVPSWYYGQIGLALPVSGAVLFCARVLDTGQDPWLGRLVDALLRRRRLGAALWIAAGVLALAFGGLWFPPRGGPGWVPVAWLALMLGLTYSAHSLLNIALLAWGARVAPDTGGRTLAATWRESAGLVGVLLAIVVAALITGGTGEHARAAMALYAVAFALILALALAALMHLAPRWVPGADPAPQRRPPAPAAVRRLWLPYTVNALAVAIPGTLALFFIADQIARPQWTGAYLASYFLSGAAATPVWARVSRRIGPARAWATAMCVAISTFLWAVFLRPGDALAFEAVCVFSGLALGADVVLPPVLLAAAIPSEHDPAAYYGVWTLLGKFATALSALALPLLSWLGYRPGSAPGASIALPLAYAAIPCALKLAALLLLVVLVIAKEKESA